MAGQANEKRKSAIRFIVVVIREKNATIFTLSSTTREKCYSIIKDEISKSIGVKAYKVIEVNEQDFKTNEVKYPRELLRKVL